MAKDKTATKSTAVKTTKPSRTARATKAKASQTKTETLRFDLSEKLGGRMRKRTFIGFAFVCVCMCSLAHKKNKAHPQ